KVNSQVTVSSLERANFLALRAGEAEGIDLLFLELAYEVLRFAGAGERAGDEPVGLAPGGHVRLVPVEQASGVALDPAPVEFQRLDVAPGRHLHPLTARMRRRRRRRCA